MVADVTEVLAKRKSCKRRRYERVEDNHVEVTGCGIER
jgi:hypothetical protein